MRPPASLAAAVAALALGCAGPGTARYAPLPEGLGEDAARTVLRRFAAATEAGRWDEAHALLSARWRAAYTPGRLAMDYAGGGPAASEAVRAVAAAAGARARVEREGGRALMQVGPEHAAVLLAEGGGWRVDALE